MRQESLGGGRSPLRVHILTLFPQMFQGPFGESMIKRAQERGVVEILLHNIRDYTSDRHRTADDYPYGGGPGMVLKPEPIFQGVESIQEDIRRRRGEAAVQDTPVILLSPQGRLFDQKLAEALSRKEELILICGHYEGVDERVAEHLATMELSIGDYILTGGELPAMVVVDAVVRLLPGVLGDMSSAQDDSLTTGLLQYPHYTRPPVYRGWAVPQVLLSGNHQAVERWRREQSLLRTFKRRPDLLAKASLSPQDLQFLKKYTRMEPDEEQGIDARLKSYGC